MKTLNEAMTPFEKMQALENGTRGFNAAAASDQKLWDNLNICQTNGFWKAHKIIQDELVRRGLLIVQQTTRQKATPTILLGEMDFHLADASFIKTNKDNEAALLSNINNADDPLKQAMITVVFASLMGYSKVVEVAKNFILDEISKQSLKLTIMECRNNPKIIERLTSICSELTEGE